MKGEALWDNIATQYSKNTCRQLKGLYVNQYVYHSKNENSERKIKNAVITLPLHRSELFYFYFYCKMATLCSGILNEDFTTKHDHAKWAISLGK
jgi:hypothetical protein